MVTHHYTLVKWSNGHKFPGPPVNIINPNNSSATVTNISAYGNYCFNYSIKNSQSNCNSNNTICYAFYNNGTVNGGAGQAISGM